MTAPPPTTNLELTPVVPNPTFPFELIFKPLVKEPPVVSAIWFEAIRYNPVSESSTKVRPGA